MTEISNEALQKLMHPSTTTLTTALKAHGLSNTYMKGVAPLKPAMNSHTNKTIHYPSEIQVPIACGGVAVFPGDIIVGDSEGVIVVPARLAEYEEWKAQRRRQ